MDMHTTDHLVEGAVNLAEQWHRANQPLTREEKHIQEQMKRLLTHPGDKVLPSRMIDQIRTSSNETRLYVSRAPVYTDGRIELRHYFRQQSTCNNYHRYGNPGDRALY